LESPEDTFHDHLAIAGGMDAWTSPLAKFADIAKGSVTAG
jgi:hypothetical protein